MTMQTFDPSVLDFRSSRFADLCGSVKKTELTDKQKETLLKFEKTEGIKITIKQQEEWDRLVAKRDAAPELDDTAKKWVQQLFREWRRMTYTKGFTGSKHTEKGNTCEQSAIDRVARVMGWGPTIKSSAEFRDAIGTGHPDIWKPRMGARADVKCSWSDETFPLFDDVLKTALYVWQAKRYCMQANVPDWWVIYCLENTPEPLVMQEAARLWKASGNTGYLTTRSGDFINNEARMFYEQTKDLHTFDHLADWERVKPFKVVLTNDDVVFSEKRVQMGRDYAETLFTEYNEHKLFIESLKVA